MPCKVIRDSKIARINYSYINNYFNKLKMGCPSSVCLLLLSKKLSVVATIYFVDIRALVPQQFISKKKMFYVHISLMFSKYFYRKSDHGHDPEVVI